MNKRTLILFLCLVVVACENSGWVIRNQIEKQFNASETVPINLALVGSPKWDRVCVLGPYTGNERTEYILGFKWDSEAKTSISRDDRITVLVFVKDKEIVAYTEYPRNKGDFSKLKPKCLVRSHSIVLREKDQDGWIYFVSK